MQLKSHLSNTPHLTPGQTLLPAPLSSTDLLQEIDVQVALLADEFRDFKSDLFFAKMKLIETLELQQGQVV